MRYFHQLLILTVIFGVVSTADDLPLEELIPKEKWEETGIVKLNQQEQRRLASEIARVIPGKPSGGSIAVIAPSVSTSLMARHVLAKLHASEVGLRRADLVLVVVR